MHRFRLLFLLPAQAGNVLAASPDAVAATLPICVPALEAPPYNYAAGRRGLLPATLRQAAAKSAIAIDIRSYPIKRCHELLRLGQVSAAVVGYSQDAAALYLFPADAAQQPGGPSQLFELQVRLYRLKGNPANFDGRQFQYADRVGVLHHSLALQAPLARHPVKVDYGNHTPAQHLEKLLARRFDLLLAIPEYLDPVIETSGMQDSVEKLPQVFMRLNVYLALSPRAGAAQLEMGRKMWRTISDMSRRGELRRLLRNEQQLLRKK